MKKIAIVDDSSTARLFIRKCFEIVGLRQAVFIEAGNGKEALDVIKKDPVDLLVTDLNMPIMDGETLLRWVKASPKLTHIPVLIISSAGNPAKEAELMKLGAYAVALKPVTPAALLHIIQPLLQQEEE